MRKAFYNCPIHNGSMAMSKCYFITDVRHFKNDLSQYMTLLCGRRMLCWEFGQQRKNAGVRNVSPQVYPGALQGRVLVTSLRPFYRRVTCNYKIGWSKAILSSQCNFYISSTAYLFSKNIPNCVPPSGSHFKIRKECDILLEASHSTKIAQHINIWTNWPTCSKCVLTDVVVSRIEAETKWTPVRRGHFDMHFREWKWLNYDWNFPEVCSHGSN